MWQQIKALREQRGEIMGQMKAILNKAQTEKRDLSAEENNKFDELNGKAEAKQAEIKRYETLHSLEQSAPQSDAGRNGNDGSESRTDDQAAVERRAEMNRYLRGEVRREEFRALSVGCIGVVGDRPFATKLVEVLKAFTGVREAGATIIPSSTGNPITIGKVNDTSNTGQIVAEATDDTTSADATVGNVTLNAYKFDSKWIKVSTELLRDAAFDVEAFIYKTAGQRIGRALNTYTTTGTGTGQPAGFVVGATTGKVAAATNAITYEELLDLLHSVDSAYRNSGMAKWQMHDLTLAAIRKLKDGDNRYIFSAGETDRPGRILGYEYVCNNDMAQLSSGVSSKVVSFGDFSSYVVRDVTTPEIIVAKELFSGAGLVGYRVFSRHDGKTTDTTAVKNLALAAA